MSTITSFQLKQINNEPVVKLHKYFLYTELENK